MKTKQHPYPFAFPGPFHVRIGILFFLLLLGALETASAVSLTVLKHESCGENGGNDGKMRVSVSGGVPPYQIRLTGLGAWQWDTPGDSTFEDLYPGTYALYVTDSLGCFATDTAEINACRNRSPLGDDAHVLLVRSQDPNDITGPSGYGPEGWVGKQLDLPYRIRFENDPVFATAPAQQVRITAPIPDHAGLFSFRLGDFGFGDFVFRIPPGRTYYTTQLDVADSLGVRVNVIAGLDVIRREAYWIFDSRDPETGLPPSDPLKGFLPVNDSIRRLGEGFVTFSIRPADSSRTGDTLEATASIVFDQNEALQTNTVHNTIDASLPQSALATTFGTVDDSTFVLNWTGTDTGAGLAGFALYSAVNQGPFRLLSDSLTGNSTVVHLHSGRSYGFQLLARDYAGNVEPPKAAAETVITTDTVDPGLQLPRPRLRPQDCGAVAGLGDTLRLTPIVGAEAYEFLLVDSAFGTTLTFRHDSVETWLVPAALPEVYAERSYAVRGRVRVGGRWSGFGTACTIVMPGVASTRILPAQCGGALPTFSSPLDVVAVSGAQDYQFRITDLATGASLLYRRGSGDPTLPLAQVAGIAPLRTYDIEVRAFAGNTWGAYGAACRVTTPSPVPVTQLNFAHCGVLLPSLDQAMYCDPVAGAEDYSYRLTDTATQAIFTYFRGNDSTDFIPSRMPFIGYGKSYRVQVRARVAGYWGDYGTPCVVGFPGLPTTQLSAASCGATLASVNAQVFCNPVPGAQQYEFRVTDQVNNAVHVIRRNFPDPWFLISHVPDLRYGRTYGVEVRSYVGGLWSAWGPSCNVTTPASPVTLLRAPWCNGGIDSIGTVLYIDSVPGATNYEYRVNQAATGLDTTYRRGNGMTDFSFAWIAGVSSGRTYTVRIRVLLDGIWGEFGTACTVAIATAPVIGATSLRPEDCGIRLATLGQLLRIVPVQGATDYEYRVRDNRTDSTYLYLRGSDRTDFSMNRIPQVTYNVNYRVDVRALRNGQPGAYGQLCIIKTPRSANSGGNGNGGNSDDGKKGILGKILAFFAKIFEWIGGLFK